MKDKLDLLDILTVQVEKRRIISGHNFRYYVCNYGRGGNRLRKKMYQPGRSCSGCPEASTCSTNYVGLCSSNTNNSGQITKGLINKKNTRTSNIITNNGITTTNRISSLNNNNIISYSQREKKRIIPNISTRREPRLAEARTMPRLEADSQRIVTRQRTYRKTQSIPCTNILCQLASFFH